MIKQFFFIFFIAFSFRTTLLGQVEGAEIIKKDGHSYYVHVVEQGNTLWGIHTLYKVPVEDIVRENPGIENGLSIGQRILVPIENGGVTDVEMPVNEGAKTHIVAGGETLYGISKTYNTSVDELLRLNPEASKGLQIGQALIVAEKRGDSTQNTTEETQQTAKKDTIQRKIMFNDSLVKYVVLPHETLYSIAKRFMVSVDTLIELNHIKKNNIKGGDEILIPLKQEKMKSVAVRQVPVNQIMDSTGNIVQFKKKENYKIVVLLPMNFSRNEAAISGMDSDAKLNGYSKIALDFYMGIKLALDSLQNLGLNASVELIDTKVDTNTVLTQLHQLEQNKPDLIIGPLMPQTLKVAAQWCKDNKVPLLSPVAGSASLLKDNRFFYASVPSDLRLLEGMADDLAQNHAIHNIILVTSGITADNDNYNLIRTRVNNQLTGNAMRSKLKEVSSKGDLGVHILRDTVNIFIFPSENRVAVSNFMTAMNKIKNIKGEKVDIEVYGLKEWENFDELKLDYKQKLNLHYPSSINLNYGDSVTTSLIRSFRKKYETDPGKFGIQGFDVTYYFIQKYILGRNVNSNTVMNEFHYNSRSFGSGNENNNVFILEYKDFDLKETARIHE